jgi:hypothetical protein
MKKIFLFVAAAALTVSLNSCSKDDDNGSSKSVSFKVDGVSKKFKVESAETAGTLFVTGYIGNIEEPTESVYFTVESGATGADAITNFNYSNANDDYSPTTLTSNVTSNSSGKAAGTFSGTLEPFDGDTNVVITDGKFSTK